MRAFVCALKFSEIGQCRRISRDKMSAFDLRECLHDPEFAPSRKGLAQIGFWPYTRSSHVYERARVNIYVCKIDSADSYWRKILDFLCLSDATRDIYAVQRYIL